MFFFQGQHTEDQSRFTETAGAPSVWGWAVVSPTPIPGSSRTPGFSRRGQELCFGLNAGLEALPASADGFCLMQQLLSGLTWQFVIPCVGLAHC